MNDVGTTRATTRYAGYVLGVLFIVNVLNFVDRQILAILAEEIKRDLGVSDAQLGFLFGTAFAVFYSTFGIALGHLADIWNRKNLISIGLSFWSAMTALSGLARSFLPLAACRFGVGVGEAGASPAALSMLCDYFAPKVRTTVLAIYSSGLFIGAGLGLYLGGSIMEAWNNQWPDSSTAPFNLKGWQAAFMVVGLPGLLLALWVSTLREPRRGGIEGVISESHHHPFRETGQVLAGMLPIINWWGLAQGGRRAVALNIAIALGICLVAWGFIELTGDRLQWIALAVGAYAVASWTQKLAIRDKVVFNLIFKCRTLVCAIIAGGAMNFMNIALSFWVAPYIQRRHGVGAADAGAVLGATAAFMGFSGVILGGLLADKLRAYTHKGKLYVWIGGMSASLLGAFVFLSTDNLILAYAGVLLMYLAGPVGHGPWLSTVNDLMLPRGRATTSAFAFMVGTFVGFGFGPYLTGHISDLIAASGVHEGEALRQAMMASLLLPLAGVGVIMLALRRVHEDESTLLARARALGETV